MKLPLKSLLFLGALGLSSLANSANTTNLPLGIVPYELKYTKCNPETGNGKAVACARLELSGFELINNKGPNAELRWAIEGRTRFSDHHQVLITMNRKVTDELEYLFQNILNKESNKTIYGDKKYYVLDANINYKVIDSFDKTIIFLREETYKDPEESWSETRLLPIKIGNEIWEYFIYDYFTPSKTKMERIFAKEWLISNCLNKANKSHKDTKAVNSCEVQANKKLSKHHEKPNRLINIFTLDSVHGLNIAWWMSGVEDTIFYPHNEDKPIVIPYSRIKAYLKPEINSLLTKNKNYQFREEPSEWY